MVSQQRRCRRIAFHPCLCAAVLRAPSASPEKWRGHKCKCALPYSTGTSPSLSTSPPIRSDPHTLSKERDGIADHDLQGFCSTDLYIASAAQRSLICPSARQLPRLLAAIWPISHSVSVCSESSMTQAVKSGRANNGLLEDPRKKQRTRTDTGEIRPIRKIRRPRFPADASTG